jgi:hypothetical protein
VGRGNRKADYSDLIRWLNNERLENDAGTGIYGVNSKASRLRLTKLIAALQAAYTELREGVTAGPWRNYWTNAPESLEARIGAIDEMLFEYPARPTIEIRGKDGSGGFYVDFASTHGRPLGEQKAVFAITRVVNEQLILHVRKCNCDRWYFARRADQRSCSPKCRHRLYEQSPEAKERRKQYMRDYYRLKKSGKVK